MSFNKRKTNFLKYRDDFIFELIVNKSVSACINDKAFCKPITKDLPKHFWQNLKTYPNIL